MTTFIFLFSVVRMKKRYCHKFHFVFWGHHDVTSCWSITVHGIFLRAKEYLFASTIQNKGVLSTSKKVHFFYTPVCGLGKWRKMFPFFKNWQKNMDMYPCTLILKEAYTWAMTFSMFTINILCLHLQTGNNTEIEAWIEYANLYTYKPFSFPKNCKSFLFYRVSVPYTSQKYNSFRENTLIRKSVNSA